eukprot:TRINITY_DN20710_c0_g1_i3.p1 TRINITY_DN20710_c0_g1~~TRINITY_DN20710_c0_g1_i3.p1  ORF type:complete len:193 (+),score=26.25 TRINITY_DN20710_c0_g1_i3:762-1340(+)
MGIVFMGDAYVGKTCLINRFMYDTFDPGYQVTVGIDFLSKTMYVEDKTIKLHLWDTAGQERFRSLIPNYVRDCAAAIVVYDITNRASFGAVKQWVLDAKQYTADSVKIMMVGNKMDLSDKRQVTAEEGAALAEEMELLFYETSAKDGTNIIEMFNKLAGLLPGLQGAEIVHPADNIALQVGDQEEKKKRRCC